jgi:adenine-specific DNA-methyltransferase
VLDESFNHLCLSQKSKTDRSPDGEPRSSQSTERRGRARSDEINRTAEEVRHRVARVLDADSDHDSTPDCRRFRDDYVNRIIHGNCIEVLSALPGGVADLAVTDPPYLVRYRSRAGKSILNDERGDWLEPAFEQIYRILKPNTFCVSFYGWPKVDQFMRAWKRARFYPVGHLVWTKRYPSNRHYVAYHHETAYVLAKGRPPYPDPPMPDVLQWRYSGNRLHPMEKAVEALEPLVRSFSSLGDLVVDPFCGSGSTLEAARRTGRRYLGIELDARHWHTAHDRMKRCG